MNLYVDRLCRVHQSAANGIPLRAFSYLFGDTIDSAAGDTPGEGLSVSRVKLQSSVDAHQDHQHDEDARLHGELAEGFRQGQRAPVGGVVEVAAIPQRGQ